jgi:hypothetical protein
VILLPDPIVAQIRAAFPRLQMAELVSRVMGFEDCFAGAKALGKEIGRSSRTVFRMFRRLREEGLVQRRWGSRKDGEFPPDADKPWALRAHGYVITTFSGWLGQLASQGRAQQKENYTKRERKNAIALLKKRRAKRAERRELHAKFRAAQGVVAKDTRAGEVFERLEREPPIKNADEALRALKYLDESYAAELDALSSRAPPD